MSAGTITDSLDGNEVDYVSKLRRLRPVWDPVRSTYPNIWPEYQSLELPGTRLLICSNRADSRWFDAASGFSSHIEMFMSLDERWSSRLITAY